MYTDILLFVTFVMHLFQKMRLCCDRDTVLGQTDAAERS